MKATNEHQSGVYIPTQVVYNLILRVLCQFLKRLGLIIVLISFQIIDKTQGRSRHKVLKEVEIFHHCKGHDNILQLIEYFEEDER